MFYLLTYLLTYVACLLLTVALLYFNHSARPIHTLAS